MKRSNWMDFTPLLDVILILIFVLLINIQIDEAHSKEAYDAAMSELKAENNVLKVQQAQWDDIDIEQAIQAKRDVETFRYLKEKIVLVNISIEGVHNQLFINEEATPLIFYQTMPLTSDERMHQISRIKRTVLEKSHAAGTGDLMLMTLTEDGKAYRFAYLLVRDALLEIVYSDETRRTYLLEF